MLRSGTGFPCGRPGMRGSSPPADRGAVAGHRAAPDDGRGRLHAGLDGARLRGWPGRRICADASAPCCNNGDYDRGCSPILVPTQTPTAVYGLCCNNKCVSPGRLRLPMGGRPHDLSGPNPNDSYATRCWPTGTDTYRCDEYVPFAGVGELVYRPACQRRECSTDRQCFDCSNSFMCDLSSLFLQIFGGPSSGRCECP